MKTSQSPKIIKMFNEKFVKTKILDEEKKSIQIFS